MKEIKNINIGKIIKSDSHINYKCRIYGVFESNEELNQTDFRFGQFVKIEAFDNIEVIGIIYNSQLYNPEYGNFGPRLSTPSSNNKVFMPDYIEETAIILDILLVGWIENNQNNQEIPPWVIPLNSEVKLLTSEETKLFHIKPNGDFNISYYSLLLSNTGNVAFQLIMNIIKNLKINAKYPQLDKLELIQQHIQWQQTTLATKV